jgi:hypothetical protein
MTSADGTRRLAWWLSGLAFLAAMVQALAAAFVVGSSYLVEYLKVRRPQRRGAQPATAATAPPSQRVPAATS